MDLPDLGHQFVLLARCDGSGRTGGEAGVVAGAGNLQGPAQQRDALSSLVLDLEDFGLSRLVRSCRDGAVDLRGDRLNRDSLVE